MKAIITGKSELQLSTLTRHYTFDIVDDDLEVVLSSQTIEESPGRVRGRLAEIVSEYKAVSEEALDVDIGEVL